MLSYSHTMPFLAGAGGITNSHRLLSMVIDNYQCYHIHGKTGVGFCQVQLTCLCTELLLSLTLQGIPWLAFLGRRRGARETSPTVLHPSSAQKHQETPAWRDTAFSPSCIFPGEAELRSQSMSTHKALKLSLQCLENSLISAHSGCLLLRHGRKMGQ